MYNSFKGDVMVDIKFHSDEKGNFCNGYPVRAFSYKDYSIDMHNHDFYEVNIVLSGKGTHCIENGRFDVEIGDVFVIPPMVAHAYIDTKELEVYHILLQKDFLNKNREETKKVPGFLQLTEIEPFLRSNFSNAFFLRLNPRQLIQLKNELDFIDDYGAFDWEKFAFMKYHTAWKILYWFSGLLNKQTKSSQNIDKTKYELQVIKTLEYIHMHFSEKITIQLLCKKVYLSRSTFLRNFQSLCGVSPIEYLNNYRCKKAIELLERSNCSKTEIAHSCGFYDLSHMERMLKSFQANN